METSPTVCLGYIHASEEDFLQRSLMTMRHWSWVSRIVVLDTNKDAKRRKLDPITRRLGKDFGYGFFLTTDEGGFDELAARNYLFELCRAEQCDWILLVDADEYFTDETYDVICKAHRQGANMLQFICYHFITPTRFSNRLTLKDRTAGRPRLITRGSLSSAPVAYQQTRASMPSYEVNKTRHCYPIFAGQMENRRVYTCTPESGIHHVHTKYLFKSKRGRAGKYLQWMEEHSEDAPPGFKLHPVIARAIEAEQK